MVDVTDSTDANATMSTSHAAAVLGVDESQLERIKDTRLLMRSFVGWQHFVDVRHATKVAIETLRTTRPGMRSTFEVSVIAEWLESAELAPLKHLTEDSARRNIAEFIVLEDLNDGDVLFLQGAPGDSWYLVIKGSINIYTLADMSVAQLRQSRYEVEMADEKLLRKAVRAKFGRLVKRTSAKVSKISDGCGFGEVALASEAALRTASAVAAEDTVVLSIPKDLYNAFINSHSASGSNVILQLSDRIEFLRQFSIFQHWRQTQLLHLAYALDHQTYPARSAVVPFKTFDDSIFFLRSGVSCVQCVDSAALLQNA